MYWGLASPQQPVILLLQMQMGDKEAINRQEGVRVCKEGGGDQSRERGKGKWIGIGFTFVKCLCETRDNAT